MYGGDGSDGGSVDEFFQYPLNFIHSIVFFPPLSSIPTAIRTRLHAHPLLLSCPSLHPQPASFDTEDLLSLGIASYYPTTFLVIPDTSLPSLHSRIIPLARSNRLFSTLAPPKTNLLRQHWDSRDPLGPATNMLRHVSPIRWTFPVSFLGELWTDTTRAL